MIYAITQIKSYRFADLYCFLKWYKNFIKVDTHILVNDNSIYDISKITSMFDNVIVLQRADTGISKHAKSQEQVVNYVINKFDIKNEDIVITPDDDEFWWYNSNVYSSFEECARSYMQKCSTNTICVPWTLMSSNYAMHNRSLQHNFIDAFKHRAEVAYIEYKPILTNIRTNGFNDMHWGNAQCKNIHNMRDPANLMYRMHINNWNADLRLYHFRFTTEEEYAFKVSGDPNTNNRRGYSGNSLNDFIRRMYGKDLSCHCVLDETLYNEYYRVKNDNMSLP